MQSISEIVQAMARQRGRTDTSPLALLRVLDGRAGERISHLPVGAELEQAWIAMTGEPFRPHQSQALTALRRNEPVVLRSSSANVVDTLALLGYALLSAEPGGAALALTHSLAAARTLHAQITRINERMPSALRFSITLVGEKQTNPYARLVICSAEALHGRVLRHHDRAWDLFWARLRTLLIPDIQHYAGVSGAHLADLLQRVRRTARAHGAPAAIATVATMSWIHNPETALTAALGAPWRVVNGDDDQLRETTLAVWRSGPTRLRDAADLALALQRNGYFVHIACEYLERALIVPMIGDIPAITVGTDLPETQALIVVGYPSAGNLRRLLNGGYQAVVLILGELPHEQMLARNVEALLNLPAPEWPPAPANAYVTAQHILCAANELPLTAEEVESWGATDIVERLAASQQLVDLPDSEICWKPGPEAHDPYEEFHLTAPSGSAIAAHNEQNRLIARLDPTTFERWAFSGAALPPLAGGQRVITRDEEHATITLRMESPIRRTLPLRRCTIDVRETRQTRTMVGGANLSWGRVVVEEEIYAYREQPATGAPTEVKLPVPLKVRWVAHACWFTLNNQAQVLGQQIGWSLAAALPLRSLVSITDITPAYDHEKQQLFMVDSHPGGNGAAGWLFAQAEQLLPLAYDIAYACRQDPFLEPLSRVDMDWLLALLGKAPQRSPEPVRAQLAVAPEPAKPQPSIARPTAYVPPVSTPTPTPPPVPAEDAPFIEIPPRQARPQPSRQEPPQQTRPQPTRQEPQPPRQEPPARQDPPPARQERFSIESPPVRQEPPRSSSTTPPPRNAPPPAEERPADADALVARLRRLREQREREGAQNQPIPQQKSNAARRPLAARFQANDQVFCLPYGNGTVVESRIEDEREILIVHFPEHGELEIDPAINLVRLIGESHGRVDELL